MKQSFQLGANGKEVVAIQDLLKAHGFDSVGPSDGDFGVRTDAAVRTFQQSQNVLVDGVVGPKTWAALVSPTPKGQSAAPNVILGTVKGQKILSHAYPEVGTVEVPDGSNGGPRVDVYTN